MRRFFDHYNDADDDECDDVKDDDDEYGVIQDDDDVEEDDGDDFIPAGRRKCEGFPVSNIKIFSRFKLI